MLVIDDELPVRALMERTLAQPGRRVISFGAAAEGMHYLGAGGDADLIICEAKSAHVNGYLVLKGLLGDARTAAIPLIFVSNDGAVERRVAALDAGATDFLPKPFHADELRARANAALRRSSLQRRLTHQNATLVNEASRDAITGLYNRRYFDRALQAAVDRAHLQHGGLAAFIGDLDHFKAVNDRFGHLKGDAVLRRIGRIIARHVRATDTVARFGGDEFAAISPDCGREGAQRIARSIIKAVRADAQCLNVAISFGAVVADEAEGVGAAQLLKAADAALYTAKRNGGSAYRMTSLSPRQEIAG